MDMYNLYSELKLMNFFSLKEKKGKGKKGRNRVHKTPHPTTHIVKFVIT